MSEILITKSNGVQEPFDRKKLERSLARSHVSMFLMEDIIQKIERELKRGTTTHDIYNKAFQLLHRTNQKSALRYSMKRSLLSLGPTGFPFEQFLAQILEKKGYKTLTGQMLQGHCTEHEVDVIAYNEHDLIVTEVKFHNDLAAKTDTKVGLYVKARFDDLRDTLFDFSNAPQKMTRGLIVTNTKFTHSVIKYAECAGIEMIGWDYPEKGNLYDLIEETKLHPLTCLTELPQAHKQLLIEKGIVSCTALEANEPLIDSLKLSSRKKQSLLEEIKNVCY